MSKVIQNIKLSDTLTISECRDGWWLYDTTRGMNLAMRAKTEQAAFVKALSYYQDRLLEVEAAYETLTRKVDVFISQFAEDE